MMPTLQVLILEDSEDDALLTQDALSRGGLDTHIEVVADAKALSAALAERTWDIVIADHGLPGFSALAALATVRAIDPDMPFVIVSGTIDETAAIEAMRRGAQDYLFKGNLARLPSVVVRELEEAEVRRSNRAHQDSIRYLVDHDASTGLPSRVWFLERLRSAIASNPAAIAVVCIVVDEFRELTYTFGPGLLDSWLTTLGDDLYRSSGLMVARVGEDRLAAILEDGSALTAIPTAAILRSLDDSTAAASTQGPDLRFRMRAGIASSWDTGLDAAESLLRGAELAATHAAQERLPWAHYSLVLDEENTRRVRLVADLKRAPLRGELSVHYQPQIDIADGAVVGLEALLRWSHPEWGPISPAEFIPLAEKAGLIEPITDWVLNAVAHQVALWEDQAFGFPVSVNISGEDLRDASFVGRFARIVSGHGLDPARLALEITESSLLSAGPAAKAALDEIRALGVRISVDDFGTGYSSLSYLHTLPLDEMKIDRSFVRASAGNERARLVLKSCLELAQKLGLSTVAEGVEDQAALAMMRTLGFTTVQGYVYARPMPPAELLEWLQGHRSSALAA